MKTKEILITSLVAIGGFTPVAYADNADNMKVNLDFRTFYMDRNFNSAIPGDTNAGGQALKAEFISPYWNDLIGVDASVVHVTPLITEKTDNSSGVLAEGGQGYTKLETGYLKLKPTENSHVKIGRMHMKTHLLNDGRSRLSFNSTEGVWGDYQLENSKLYAFYTNKAAKNNNEDFTSYSANGKDYGIASLGAKHNFGNGFSGELQYAIADDYLKQSFANLRYKTIVGDNSNLMLDAKHLRGEDAGDLYGKDYDSNLTAITARLSSGDIAYMLSYQAVGGSDKYSQQWGGSDNTQFWTSGAVQFLDFNAKDEKTLQARIDYDVPSIDGLHLMARHSQSSDVDYAGGTDGKRKETDLDIKYAVSTGIAKGLNFQLRLAKVDMDEGIAPFTKVTDTRFIMDYKVSF